MLSPESQLKAIRFTAGEPSIRDVGRQPALDDVDSRVDKQCISALVLLAADCSIRPEVIVAAVL